MPIYATTDILRPELVFRDEVYVDSETLTRLTGQMDVEQDEVQTEAPAPAPASLPKVEIEADHAAKHPVDAGKVFEVAAMPPNPSELSYSCVLIPRFSDHYLTGDIVNDLGIWMKDICIAFGWRLEALVIRPGYIHWTMTVPLTASPARFIKTICQQTSQKIFEYYPRFKRINPSLDFWAPGFSVASGMSPQSVDDINAFILQTRRQQGIF